VCSSDRSILKNLVIKRAALNGDINLDCLVGKLTLEDITDGADINIDDTSSGRIKIKAGDIEDGTEIDINGNVYSHYLDITGIDEHIITILIENEGWLVKDIDNDEYINYVGNIYNRKDDVVEKTWRGQKIWAPYTKTQLNSAVKLCKYHCNTFGIPQETVSHNTKFEGIHELMGVVYKSNFDKYYSDLSPAWDYVDFKNKLESN